MGKGLQEKKATTQYLRQELVRHWRGLVLHEAAGHPSLQCTCFFMGTEYNSFWRVRDPPWGQLMRGDAGRPGGSHK